VREAVVVLDMTRDSIAPEARAVEMRRAILPRVKSYLAWARGKGTPVVFVCSARRRTDKWFLKHWELANEIWKSGQEPIPEIFESTDTIVHKRRYSGFFGSDLDSPPEASLHGGRVGASYRACPEAAESALQGAHSLNSRLPSPFPL